MKSRLLIVGALLALFATACADNRTAPPAPDTAATAAPATEAPGGGSEPGANASPSAGDASAGEELFNGSCTACHGQGAVGIEGLGKGLIDNAFIAGLDDAALVEFIIVGRLADDPANTTGIAMPAKGGNPSLSDDQLGDIVAYLRTLN